jgi:ornithine cyclodeaminase
MDGWADALPRPTKASVAVLALSRSDLKRLVPMSEAIELMKLAFTELSAGRATAPLRTVIDVDREPSAMLIMPAFVPAASSLGFKVVSFFGGNPKHNLPTIHALVCLVDHETGVPLAIMEGGYVTALRTGAVSGAATDLLARKDAKTLAVIGAGVQGVTQAAAVCAVRPIERVIVVDSRPEAFPRYVDTIRKDWPDVADRIETTTDAGAAVRAADVICTATTAKSPVFDDADLRPGTHINAVGAFTPEMQEVPPATVVRATIVVDAVDAALAEAGDLIIPLRQGLIDQDRFARELGAVAAGTAPGRTSDDEITFFKSVGNAVQDVVVARRAVDRANELGAGAQLDLIG